MSESFCQYGKKGVCKQQKVVALNEAMEWRNALEQRVIFLDHLEQLIKLFELYPKDFIRLQDDLKEARDKTVWSIQECKKQFAYTRQRFESGFDDLNELSEGVMICNKK